MSQFSRFWAREQNFLAEGFGAGRVVLAALKAIRFRTRNSQSCYGIGYGIPLLLGLSERKSFTISVCSSSLQNNA